MPNDTRDVPVPFVLNGRPVQAEAGLDLSLLDALRECFGITSPKNGCAPMGQCGCCTVLVDGRPKLACQMKLHQVAGKSVTTLEGLTEEARRQLADCFVGAGAVQCGFCTPGIAMRTYALLERNPNPTRAEILADLAAHLCRCTGYKKIIEAVELLARVRRGEILSPPKAVTTAEPLSGKAVPQASDAHMKTRNLCPPLPVIEFTGEMPVPQTLGGVGARLEKYDGRALVLGQRPFVDDITVPGMVFAAMRFSDHPRALVKRIDPSPVAVVEGVIRVLTWRDVPGERHVGLIEQDWPVLVAEGEETRYVGDVIAVVVAKDVHTARRAAELVEVDYEIRDPIVDPQTALQPETPKIHPGGNLLSRSALKYGDAETALAASVHTVEGVWETQRIEHFYLEPEACSAIPQPQAHGSECVGWSREPPLALRVLSQGQGVFDDRRQIANVLGWQPAQVHVELMPTGGAFGGKEDLSVQAQTALAAYLTGLPVKTTLTREESLRLHPKRHPIRLHYRVGCDAAGRLTALHARIIGDTGAYASVGAKVLERCAGHAGGPYRLPNIDIEALAAYTNNPPCGAMRGFGVNQAAFAMEACLDMLAERVGLDGWEMRSRNILEPGDRFCTGQRMTKPFGLRKTLEAVKAAYRGAKYAGIACGIKNVGIGNGMPEAGRASLTVEPSGRVTVRSGFTEMGQGLFTVLIQTAVQETGLPAHLFDATTDTRDALDCGETTASRGTVLGCHGVIAAARKLRADLDAGKTLDDLIGRVYEGKWRCYPTDKFGADVPDPKTHLSYGFATQVAILNDDGSVARIIAAHDVGRAINPTLLEGQIEGAVHMGLGYALTEEFVVEGGRVVTKDANGCGVLRAHQMPEVEVILVEEGDPDCPYGARGVGEIGLVPTAPAIAGALYKFDGVRRMKLPMRDSPAAQALHRKKAMS